MSKAVLILAVVCCFLVVSSSIGGALFWFRCYLELVDCPEPETTSEKVKGCTDSKATNYNASATEDNGSCEYTFDEAWGNLTRGGGELKWENMLYIKTDGTLNKSAASENRMEFVSAQKCAEYVMKNLPDYKVITYTHGNDYDEGDKSCGVWDSPMTGYGDPGEGDEWQEFNKTACTTPGVTLANNCET